MTVMMTMTINI